MSQSFLVQPKEAGRQRCGNGERRHLCLSGGQMLSPRFFGAPLVISGQSWSSWASTNATCTSDLQVSHQHRGCFFLGKSSNIAHRCVCTRRRTPALYFPASSSWAPDFLSVGRRLAAAAWHSLSTPNGCLVDAHPAGLAFSRSCPRCHQPDMADYAGMGTYQDQKALLCWSDACTESCRVS